MTPKFSRYFAYIKCDYNVGEAVEQANNLCDEVERIMEFIYLVTG